MKYLTIIVISLLFSANALAYGGGAGFLLPPPLYQNFLSPRLNIPNDLWIINPSAGEHIHKIFNKKLPLREVNLTIDDTNLIYFWISGLKKEYDGLLYSAFRINSNLDVDKIKNIRLIIEVNTRWLIDNEVNVVYVLKDDESIPTTQFYQDAEITMYYIDIKDFSEFLIIGKLIGQ